MVTRPPTVAGRFYPADPAELRVTVEELLADAPSPPGPSDASAGWPKAIIAPHAAYRYSGPVAASAYRALQPGRGSIRRVVLLGPAHRLPLRQIAASSANSWSTPLGPLALDTVARDDLLRRGLIGLHDPAHEAEHSLEVQLPFISTVLGRVQLLPLLVGGIPPSRVAELLEAVAGGLETAIVVSTDLSHYHHQATAERLDSETAAAICAADPAGVAWDRACGVDALRGLLAWARRHRLEVRLLDLRTSGDIVGDMKQVVGYGAFAVA